MSQDVISVPLKSVAGINSSTLGEKTDPEKQIRYIDISSVSKNGFNGAHQSFTFEAAPSRARRKLKEGSTIIATVRTYLKAVAYFSRPQPDEVVSTGFAVLDPKESIDSRYLYYRVAADDFVQQVEAHSVGVSYPAINPSDLAKLKLTVPGSKPHQTRIADYLDEKTAIIDKMIVAKNHTHTQLLELRQAIITNAVLGRGGVAMNLRQTNIPWIGAIPDHWQVKKIKHVAIVKARIGWQALTTDEYIDEGPYLVTGTDFREGAVDWKTAAHVSDQRWAIDSNIQLEEDDLLLTKDGTIGKVAMVKDLHGKATLNSGVFVIRAKSGEYNPRYLYHVLNSGVFNDFIEYMKTGSTINHLYQQTFVEFSFPLPPRGEQDKIVAEIEKKLAKVDDVLARVTSSTKLLEEYRSSLISNVVGGKVEV